MRGLTRARREGLSWLREQAVWRAHHQDSSPGWPPPCFSTGAFPQAARLPPGLAGTFAPRAAQESQNHVPWYTAQPWMEGLFCHSPEFTQTDRGPASRERRVRSPWKKGGEWEGRRVMVTCGKCQLPHVGRESGSYCVG